MAEVTLTFGQIGFDEKSKINFPPENAKKTSTPKDKNTLDISLIPNKNKNKEIDR